MSLKYNIICHQRMKKYCCRELHQIEDDSWQRGFGLNILEKNRVEIFCMDDEGYPERIDEYI
ncbi:hypothetical protein BH23THE1_BH23THE1_12320 [soil metagenome]